MIAAGEIPDPVALAGFLGCLFFLVAGINAVMKVVDRMRDKPPAGEVAKHTAEFYATKEQLKDHVSADFQEHSNLWAKIGGLERGLRGDLQETERRIVASAEAGRENLHGRINEVLAAVSEVKGEIKHLTGKNNETMRH